MRQTNAHQMTENLQSPSVISLSTLNMVMRIQHFNLSEPALIGSTDPAEDTTSCDIFLHFIYQLNIIKLKE